MSRAEQRAIKRLHEHIMANIGYMRPPSKSIIRASQKAANDAQKDIKKFMARHPKAENLRNLMAFLIEHNHCKTLSGAYKKARELTNV